MEIAYLLCCMFLSCYIRGPVESRADLTTDEARYQHGKVFLMHSTRVRRNTAPTAPEEKLLQEKHKLTAATL